MTNTKKITENKNHPNMKTNNNERQNKTKLFRLSQFLFLSDGKKMCIKKRQCPSRIHSSMKLIDMTKRNLSTLSSFSFLERTKVHRIVIHMRDAYFIYSDFQYLSGHHVELSSFWYFPRRFDVITIIFVIREHFFSFIVDFSKSIYRI